MNTHASDPALFRAIRGYLSDIGDNPRTDEEITAAILSVTTGRPVGARPTSSPREGRDGTDARARAIARIEAQADARAAVAAISTIIRGAEVEGAARLDVVGSSSKITAADWHRYGFTPAEVERWLEVGVYEAPVAAELRGLDVLPVGPVWSEEVAGLRLGIAVSEGDVTVAEVARMFARA